jgi:predicted RNA-binding Zn-ribbon protein involved in translation (DUF1610 family)
MRLVAGGGGGSGPAQNAHRRKRQAAKRRGPKMDERAVDYTCGQCGAILLHAQENRVHSIVIHCGNCGSHNSTDS